MSVRDQVLAFLREPGPFATGIGPAQRKAWLDALAFAEASIVAKGDRPLRPAQEAAWRGLAGARAALILGPPGTGKTHLLSWLATANAEIERRSSRNWRVLVTAFTKNAAGNLLAAIADTAAKHLKDPPAAVFLGNPPPAGLPVAVRHIERLDKQGLKQAVEELQRPQVFAACTVWSLARVMKSGLLSGADGWTAPLFDLVCIDEASQMVLGHGLLALSGLAEHGRVVVAGDDRQLPPVRSVQEANIDGREIGSSLYKFLSSVHAPEFVLEETFRLNQALSAFPAVKFYGGRYFSADAVARRRLVYREGWDQGLESWEKAVLNPDYPIVVLLHDGPPAATTNDFEAALTARIAQRFKAAFGEMSDAKFWEERLAVVSPHRAQNASIRAALGTTAIVETVERIQGKERDALILSYCVTDPEFALAEAEFIFSRERFNVAITRARSKLILIVGRRLLDLVPPEQEVLDSAELLREFVYGCTDLATLELSAPHGVRVSTNIRIRAFSDDVVLPTIEPSRPDGEELGVVMTPELQALLEAIKQSALSNEWGTATSSDVKRRLARRNLEAVQLRDLMRLGQIGLEVRKGPYGEFWAIRPYDPPRRPFSADAQSVEKRIEEVIISERTGRRPPLYTRIRNRFVWIDASGNDVLWPQLQALSRAGKIQLGETNKGPTVDIAREAPQQGISPVEAPSSTVSDEDFVLLNCLENIEARRINFGIVEGWTSIGQLARDCGKGRAEVASSIGRLEQHGFLLVASEQRLRSRMSELAREVRYLKQRFAKADSDKRPFLVRSLKVETRGRRRPRYDHKLSEVLERLRDDFADRPHLLLAIEALGKCLKKIWAKDDPGLAGFQARGLREIALSWYRRGPQSYVVTAETGSGKTEAACLPLILGAAADRLDGKVGTRAVLVYPRVRLAANQSQRLARYLAAFSRIENMPVLTLGLQTGQVPQHFEMPPGEWEELWPRSGAGRAFPFFACPECGGQLNLLPAGGVNGADCLTCLSCGWRYDGWIGSKQGLRQTPPNFFLPTTESLHQWLHDPSYAVIFGDLKGGAAPRAVLADEIHLYTHIHGAQVGFALRRLLARAEHNNPDSGPPLAIGMSATLGRPAEAWSRLCGRSEVVELRPDSNDTSDNPRGREYFYFVQPEVESRGRDIAGASTTIQSLMCLAHGMRRRTGKEGGYRSLVFLDSIDKLRRLHSAYSDAEEAKSLASYRTHLYDDSPTGEVQTECCREPVGCDAFRNGECWYFAATDQHQWGSLGRFASGRPLKVTDRPIFSGTSGRAEDLIKGSDVVFTTSSLEVGYDDPDINLVYQHYAPRNLASFVQRKGRAGRGNDDRSLTAITLSPYSPRDSWYFRQPRLMIEATGFEVPLNPDNFFVLRGQLLATFLDSFARFEVRNGASALNAKLEPDPRALTEVESLAGRLFGSEPWRRFGVETARAFWVRALQASVIDASKPNSLPNLRRALAWVPDMLFDTINLPALRVRTDQRDEGTREDVPFALTTIAPGNMTRRYDGRAAHWIVPVDGFAPWFQPQEYDDSAFGEPLPDLSLGLPTDVRESLEPIHPRLFRPISVRLTTAGEFWGADWDSRFVCDSSGPRPKVTKGDKASISVHHESRSTLSGCVIITTVSNAGSELTRGGIESYVSHAKAYRGDSLGRHGSGLNVTQVYWGAEAELRLKDPKLEPVPITQRFKHPHRNETLLHGYRLETEGIRFHLNSALLDSFVDAEIKKIQGTEEHRWYSAQMLRYLLEDRARCSGINGYDARRGAELLVSAAGDPDLKKRLKHLLRFWDPDALKSLLQDTFKSTLAQHPLLTERRVERTATVLGTDPFRQLLQSAIAEINTPASFTGYLRSLVLHSLAVRLKQSYLLVGRGEDERILVHVRLPIQFGDTDDIITVAEVGEGGDGTTRTCVQQWDSILHNWRSGFLTQCLSAREDAVVEQLFASEQHHARWRSLDPRSESDVRELAAELGGGDLPISSLLRILFGTEMVGHERFELYDLTREIRDAGANLRRRLERQPSVWELVSAAVLQAKQQEGGQLASLLKAYAKIDDASQEESLGAPARLADQVYRLSARLCVDGCQTCVHSGTDMMSSSLAEASTSRTLLERFIAN